MTDFDIIEYGYNIADETINFGTRCLADGDNLYEVSTLATLKCSESEGKVRPHLNSLVQNGRIYFNIDSCFRIFKDKDCSDIVFNGSFSAIIDTFCVSADGNYVLLCLRDGNMHLIDCSDECKVISSMALDNQDYSDTYFISLFQNDDNFLVVTKAGQVYRIFIQNHTEVMAQCIHEFHFKIEIGSFQYPFLLVNGTKLEILDLRDHHHISGQSCDFKRVFPIDNMFLGLDFEGKLFAICALSLVIFPMGDTIFKDFLLVSGDNDKKQIVTVVENDSKQSFVQLLSYPEFSTIYSIKVSTDVHLITPESINDELLYISKISIDDSITELRFHMVYETEAEQRLQRLLKKHKYEEALKFAALFRLDPAMINKARAQAIIDKSVCDSEDINSLINLLNVIDDDEFKLHCCLDVVESCRHFDDVRKILNYGCSLVPKKQQNKSVVEDLQKSVIHLMFRFDTFLALNRGDDYEMQSWLQFSRCDLIEELRQFLRKCQIQQAEIIYSRLDELTVKSLTKDRIADVLQDLKNLPIAAYQPFLQSFIPITLSILPSTLPLFVKWTYDKVFHLEKRSKIDFPNNAIKFTENIVGLMKVRDVSDISFQRQCLLLRDSLANLSVLLSTLKSLKTLRDDFRITVPMNAYLSKARDVVSSLLNIEMCREDLDIFLRDFLSKFMLEKQLEPNEIFFDEIINLMKYEERYWINVVPSILNCISSTSLKLEAVKKILDSAAVPWCKTVRKIAIDSLKHFHPLVTEIKELIDNEPVQVVLRKPKYKLKERRITDINTLKFVISRIIYCKEETMVKDVYQLCKTAEDRHVSNMLLIKHFIRFRNFEKAMDLLDNNAPEEILKCAKELALSVETVVNNETRASAELRDGYYEIAGSIFKRLNDNSDDFDRSWYEETLSLVRNTYNLEKNFQIKSSSHSLRRSSNKNTILNDLLEEVCREFEAGGRTAEEVFTTCRKISASLSLENDDVLVKFCELSGDYSVILKSAQRIYNQQSTAKNMCLMAVLLIKYVGIYKIQLSDDSFSDSKSLILSDSDNVIDNDVFCNGLRLADKIMSKAIYKARSEEISMCMEIANWVRTSFYFTRSEDSGLRKTLFGDMFDSASVLPGFLTFTCIRKAFNVYRSVIGSNDTYLTHFKRESFTEDQILEEIKQLPNTIENLCKEGQHYTSFKIIATLKDFLMHVPNPNPSILTFLNEIIKKRCLPKLIPLVVSNTVVDGDLLYNLLLCCDRDDGIVLIKNSLKLYKRHPKKFTAILQTGLRFWQYHNLTVGKAEMMKALITLKWWKKVDKKKLEYDSFCKASSADRFELLVNADCLDTKLVEEYAIDYGICPKLSNHIFLKRTLLNWKPEYEIKVDTSNKKYLQVKNNEDVLLKKCQDIMKVVTTEAVLSVISEVWSCINRYYYEVFIAMFNILGETDPKQDNGTKISMLVFLKNYQRVSKPSEPETEQWYTTFPDTQSLDVLSEFRLPFTPHLFTKQIWGIIRPEINLKTYKLWFSAIEIVSPYLSKNDICSYVVNDVVASGVLSEGVTSEWVLYPKHEDLFVEIDECVQHISDLERATSVTYHLLIHTPNGADQVNAATLCYKYARGYKNLHPKVSDVEKAFIKVERRYFNSCALHILHTYQLAQTKYVNLVAHPKDLILALYLDERILKQSESVSLYCPDINKATEALAQLFNLDIGKIRHSLMESWLLDCPTSVCDLESSVVYSQDSSICESDILKRAAYMCCSSVEFWQVHLFQMGLDSEVEERVHRASARARALKVFAMISDVETIAHFTETTYDEFICYIDKLTLVSNLEYLGIGLNVEGLDNHNKKELLNRLAQRADNLITIKTMAGICMTYKIYDLKYWEFIVNTSIKFSSFVELKSYVNFLRTMKCQYKNFYINAWQKLIENSFACINNTRGSQLDEILIQNFLTIQGCPVLYSLNFDKVFNKCMEAGKVEFAALVLQYVEGERRDKFVKEIRKSDKDFGKRLGYLLENGLWGIPHVQEILRSVQ